MQPAFAPVLRSLREVQIASASDLFASYTGRAADLKPWLAGAPINRDGNLRLQYLAGLGLNINQPEAIYRDILRYRRYPDDLFAGSAQSLARLRSAIEHPPAPQ
jgi:spermidine synthase